MATIAAQTASTASVRPIPDLRYEHLFFSGMSIAMLITVFAGFARTYYLAGVFRAPLPSLIIHIHGAAFTCWILLLVTQTSLVAAHRTAIHRKLGLAGFFLACAMVVLGVLAGTDNLLRAHDVAGRDPKMFYIVPLTDMLLFGTFIYFALRARLNPPAHKRYIFLATTALLVAAIARLPFAFLSRKNRSPAPHPTSFSSPSSLTIFGQRAKSIASRSGPAFSSSSCNNPASPSARPHSGTVSPHGFRPTPAKPLRRRARLSYPY